MLFCGDKMMKIIVLREADFNFNFQCFSVRFFPSFRGNYILTGRGARRLDYVMHSTTFYRIRK